MRRFFTILIIALSINAFSQSKHPLFPIHYPTVNPSWNSQTYISDAGITEPRMSPNIYNGNEIKLQKLEQKPVIQIFDSIYYWSLDTLHPGMKLVSKTINMVYDANNNMTSYLSQSWNDSVWLNVGGAILSYDANNNRTGILFQDWDGNAWVNSSQNFEPYDANNNLISSLHQYWNGITWVNSGQSINTYDVNNNCISTLYQHWDSSTWVNSSQYINTYDINNNGISTLFQIWDSSSWVNYDQDNSTFDANNNLINSILQNWVDNTWRNSWNNNYTYDTRNNWISYLTQYWNGSVWLNASLYNFTYDANNNQLSSVDQSWNGSAWVKSYTVNLTYDTNNFQLSNLGKAWNNTGTKITKADSSYYYFHTVFTGINDLKAQNGSISVYPNPATNKITISTNNMLPGEIEVSILGLNGQNIKQARFQNQKQFEMNVSCLAKGIYLVKIQSSTGVDTKKLVIH